MLNALLLIPNPKFNASIDQIKYYIDSGIVFNNHMVRDDLSNVSCAKYNNIVASDEYSKLDPKDGKNIALTTKVTALERSVSANSENLKSRCGSGGGYRRSQGENFACVEKWRTVNKGSTIQHEGKKVWWCPSHKQKDVLFDSL